MSSNRISVSRLKPEIEISTARSGGPGGQHVNKVETKVILRWNVNKSELISELEKQMIRAAHSTKITKDGDIIVTADSKRSQVKNKEIAFKKLDRMLAKAFTKKKARKPSQPTKASQKKRLDSKKKHAEKKRLRQKPF